MATPDRVAEGTKLSDVNLSPEATSSIVGLVQDFLKIFSQLGYYDQIFSGKAGFLESTWNMLETFTSAGPEGEIGALRTELEKQLDIVKLGLQAGIWGGMGSTFANLAEKWMGTGQILSAYKNLTINTALVPRMQRRYNRYWRPSYPNFHLAFQLYMRDHITEPELKQAFAMDGWPDKFYEGLLDVYSRAPSHIEAFYMWRKGSIKEDVIKKRMKAEGYETGWHDTLLENLWYVPTLYDLVRLADYVEIPETWCVKQLKYRGMRDEDIAMIYPMIQTRYLREEQRLLSTKWQWRRRYGLCTVDELEDALIRIGFKEKEREYIMEKAEMDYEDELNYEKRQVCTAQYRSGTITYDEYIACLEATGMAHEKANVTADYDQASGYQGYY